MIGTLLRVVGLGLQRQITSLKVQAEDWKHRTANEVKRQVADTSITIGIAFVGLVLGMLTVITGAIALYLWIAMIHGPFTALAVVGCILAVLAALMFIVAGTRSSLPSPGVLDTAAQASSPSIESSLYRSTPNVSTVDAFKNDLMNKTAAAANDALDSTVDLLRKAPREALLATLVIAVVIGVVVGRRR